MLDGGRAGATFRSEDSAALGREIVGLVADPTARAVLAEQGRRRARQFDWTVVAEDVLAVYEMATHGAGRVRADTSGDTRWTRLLRGLSRSTDD